jgi:O-glycosyl hydrolase
MMFVKRFVATLFILAAILFTQCLADTNILTNPGFETGDTTGWTGRSATISAVTSPAPHPGGGTYCGRATGRTATWQGIQQNVLNKMVEGSTYTMSGWVRISSGNATVKMSVEMHDDDGTHYYNPATGTAHSGSWVQISGSYTLTVNGTLSALYVYFEGPASGVDIYVDDAVVYGPEVGPTEPNATGTVDVDTRYQTIEGFGAAGAWYEGTLVQLGNSNPQIYNVLFRDLGLDIYRLRNAYQESNGASYMSSSSTIISHGEAALGRPVKTLVCSWSPPASLKSDANTIGGTLAGGPSNYVYSDFANWWADSITAWSNAGVEVNYISLQNELDYENTQWDTCRFDPTENSTNAGYDEALDAVYDELYSRFGSAMPKIIGPETTGFNGAAGGSLNTYLSAVTHLSHLYGYAHHLYNINAGDNPDAYISAMQSFNSSWGTKPLFQTEYEKATGSWPDAYNMALLLHDALTVEQVASYFYWDLFWGSANTALVSITSSSYTINSDYYGFRQYSAFIDSGWQRVDATDDSDALRMSAYINPTDDKLTVVVINTSTTTDITLDLSFTGFSVSSGEVYRTSQTENCVDKGAFANPVTLPARSVTTLSLQAPAVPQQTLSVSSTSGGSVTTPGEGDFSYDQGTDASIVATADSHYHFVNWTGTAVTAGKVASPGSASTTVLMDADYTVVANFAIDQQTLTTSSTSGGSVTTPGEGAYGYDYGTNASIVATADSNYHFVAWSGTAVTAGKVADPNSTSTTVLMDADYTAVANFAADIVKKTLITSSTSGGSVTTPGEGSFEYDQGTVVNIVASPNTDYNFVVWTGTAVTAGKVADPCAASTAVTMDDDYTVTANFEGIPPAAPTGLTATSGNNLISLDWSDNNEPDLQGYNVYRSTTHGSGYAKINGTLVADSNYVDNTAINGTPYYYVVTAVDTGANESGYSNEASATPDYQDCNDVKAGGYGLVSDLNGDCHVDLRDVEIIARYWLHTDCAALDNCENADMKPNGDVDFLDFSDFAIDWMQCNDPQDSSCTPNW